MSQIHELRIRTSRDDDHKFQINDRCRGINVALGPWRTWYTHPVRQLNRRWYRHKLSVIDIHCHKRIQNCAATTCNSNKHVVWRWKKNVFCREISILLHQVESVTISISSITRTHVLTAIRWHWPWIVDDVVRTATKRQMNCPSEFTRIVYARKML